MTKLAYNIVKNTSIRYMYFELNRGYYLYVSYKKDNNFHFRFKAADKLSKTLRDLINIYKKNL